MTRTIDLPTLIPEPEADREFSVDLEQIRREIAAAISSNSTVRARNEGGVIVIGIEPEPERKVVGL